MREVGRTTFPPPIILERCPWQYRSTCDCGNRTRNGAVERSDSLRKAHPLPEEADLDPALRGAEPFERIVLIRGLRAVHGDEQVPDPQARRSRDLLFCLVRIPCISKAGSEAGLTSLQNTRSWAGMC